MDFTRIGSFYCRGFNLILAFRVNKMGESLHMFSIMCVKLQYFVFKDLRYINNYFLKLQKTRNFITEFWFILTKKKERGK